jgi:hypothetical protein
MGATAGAAVAVGAGLAAAAIVVLVLLELGTRPMRLPEPIWAAVVITESGNIRRASLSGARASKIYHKHPRESNKVAPI